MADRKTRSDRWIPTDEERAQILQYAAVGLTQTQMSLLIGRSVDLLDRECRFELDTGRSNMIAKIASVVVNKALDGDTASCFFYLKTQAGWRETERREHVGDNGGPIKLLLTPDDVDL